MALYLKNDDPDLMNQMTIRQGDRSISKTGYQLF
jgi:hypothetical protein